MLAEPVCSLGIQAPESSPLRRKCRRARPQGKRKPEPARRATVARVAGMASGSEQPIVLGRRPARMCRIDGLRRMAEMIQNPLDHCGFLDAGDHPQLPAALSAGLNVYGEYPLKALRP